MVAKVFHLGMALSLGNGTGAGEFVDVLMHLAELHTCEQLSTSLWLSCLSAAADTCMLCHRGEVAPLQAHYRPQAADQRVCPYIICTKLFLLSATCTTAADPLYAREKVWIPFMKQELGCGPDTIVVVSTAQAFDAEAWCSLLYRPCYT